MNKHPYKVLLIEDDPMVQEVNKQFIERVQGFKVIGIANNGIEGLTMIQELRPDIAILDIYMPNQDGLETLSLLRKSATPIDVIAVTAANDIETVRRVLQLGAVDYIMKPFKFERMKQALENYISYQKKLSDKDKLSQNELDLLLYGNNKTTEKILPKGLNAITLNKILSYLSSINEPVSAEEVAEGIGLARVTARRYLEYLEKEGRVCIKIKYGGVGRPINRYVIENSFN
ncbi:response regulator [Bacillus solimangrovi]|uniref:Two-component system response regulator n=1 Tax=Bacillus solimangrovi TaxID=1305675 RepID=A0A1E5LDE8_9BACI|nr:response regulator [Bacillus solimangrovi]OEH92106.1 two-component system response regulator [Bacillus solimangrovi]